MDNLASGAGGSHDPGMEARLQRLEDAMPRIEALMKSVDDRLRHVETEVAEVKGRVSALPSTWAMVTTMLGGQVALAALLAAIFRIAVPH